IERKPLFGGRIPGPVGNVRIRRVSTLCEVGIHVPLEIIALGPIDRSAVLRSPFPYGLQNFYRFLRYRTVRFGTDIQHIVSSTARTGDRSEEHTSELQSR